MKKVGSLIRQLLPRRDVPLRQNARAQKLLLLLLAAFFVAVFPGNLAQAAGKRSAFGLDSDGARIGRLFFQPVLVAWALWSTRD